VADDEPYDIIVAPDARRALTHRLPPEAAFAAWEFARGPLAAAPRRVGAPLRSPFDGLWRARRGAYRIRYRIDEEKHRVVILDIDHRQDAYHT
jgi:mRNA interferase RelE/StbE